MTLAVCFQQAQDPTAYAVIHTCQLLGERGGETSRHMKGEEGNHCWRCIGPLGCFRERSPMPQSAPEGFIRVGRGMGLGEDEQYPFY